MELLIVGLACVIIGFASGIFINKHYSRKNYDLQSDMKTVFRGISTEILTENQNSFFESVKPILANHNKDSESNLNDHKNKLDKLIEPLTKNLETISNKTQEIEKSRIDAYSDIKTRIGSLCNSEQNLLSQVSKLETVLRSSSQTRGSWGEMQLRNIIELTGMSKHCFEEQKKLPNDKRPDMILNLPGNRKVIIDAKSPEFFDFGDSSNIDDKKEGIFFDKIRELLRDLGSRKYQELVGDSFDFVIMFLPIESMFKLIVDKNFKLIEKGFSNNVLIASPTTLIAMLRTISFSWREKKLSENAKEISKLGGDLYKRFLKFNEHMTSLSKNLTSTVNKFNDHLGSYERMLIPGARKLREMGASGEIEELESPKGIEVTPNRPQLYDSKN